MAESTREEITVFPPYEQTNKEAFFQSEPSEIPLQAIRILRDYSKVPENEIKSHCINIRNAAWKVVRLSLGGQVRFSLAYS